MKADPQDSHLTNNSLEEGKITSTSIGLVDALSAIGEKPSLPCASLLWPCLLGSQELLVAVRPSGSNGRYQPSLYRRLPCH